MGGIENVTPFAIGTVLDPRFNPLACSAAVAKVKDLIKTTAQNEVEQDFLGNSEKPPDNFCLWEDHHSSL